MLLVLVSSLVPVLRLTPHTYDREVSRRSAYYREISEHSFSYVGANQTMITGTKYRPFPIIVVVALAGFL